MSVCVVKPVSQPLCPRLLLLIVCAGEELEPWKGLTVGSTRTKDSQFDLQGWTGLGWGILVCFRPASPAASPLLPSPPHPPPPWYCYCYCSWDLLLSCSSSRAPIAQPSPAEPSSPVRPSPGPGFLSPCHALSRRRHTTGLISALLNLVLLQALTTHRVLGTPRTQPSSQAANSAAETQPLIPYPSLFSPLHASSTQCVARGVRSCLPR